jgi:twitching motility protein PilT
MNCWSPTAQVRNLVRENNLHHLENCIQTGARDGMVLMDSSLHDLYSKCQISYDTALSRARNPDRIAKGLDRTRLYPA